MLATSTLQDKRNGNPNEEYQNGFLVNGHDHDVCVESVINNNPTEISNWAREAVALMGQEDVKSLEKALYYMNLCLDEKFRNQYLAEKNKDSGSSCPEQLAKENYTLSDSDELILLEKRCLVQMRLKMYDKVWEGAARIIAKRSNHTIAFKCILASICKTEKYSNAAEVLNLWKKCAPNDLDMIEARTKVESLINAVKNGIEPASAFSDIEETLCLAADWKAGPGRKIYEPQWKYRPVPPGANTFVLCLQHRFGHCSLGEKCPDAHGQQELEEWKLRYSISDLSTVLACNQLDLDAAYLKTITEALSQVENEKLILVEEMSGVTLTCSEALHTQIQSSTMKSHTWEFKLDSNLPLTHICLLYEVHRSYFKIGSTFFNGVTDSVNLKTGKAVEPASQVLEVSICPAALALAGFLPNSYSYTVEVICTPDVYGTFRQTILFDFGGKQKLSRDISVEVVPQCDEDSASEQTLLLTSFQKTDSADKKSSLFGSNLKARGTWHFGNADIVDSATGERVSSSKVGFALMPPPTTKSGDTSTGDDKTYQYELTKKNYKERMRFFLTQEERARQVILSKYNISAHLTILQSYELKGGHNEGTRYTVGGSLFGSMLLFRDISEDTPVGRLILRSCNSVLLAKTESINKSELNGIKPRVYLCPIVEKTKNTMYFEIGKYCVDELKLAVSKVSSFDIQFQLNRTIFMEQKTVIDRISDSHLDMLFPDFTKDFKIPWNPLMQWNPSVESKSVRLNPKQKEAFNAVTAKTSKTPPVLIIGPFGTGKTFTLFQCIKKLLEDSSDSRIMICTHSNSAADLYIKEYLDPLVKSGNECARPLRIYYSGRSKVTVHRDIQAYCLMDEQDRFRTPTKDEVLKHRIIVVTLNTSFLMMSLNLPSDAFTHILLDEAAQAMECEAITPLLSAGENTKLVLAGDHMQLSPEVFSEDAKHFHSSLLERLHCAYPASHPCKLMLCENYRSHFAIIKFASDSFYQNKLECGMIQPVHEKLYPLTFFAARGEDVQDRDSTSYYNMAEVFEVTERVVELIRTWPEKWGDWKNDNQIGVLTPYADQVIKIRLRLRKKGFHSVTVERVLNVQGKQFRAVFLSTVRTHKPWVRILPEAVGNEVDMGFFSNPKLLNTALTRAQSLVAVVGDPVSLSALGKCRRLWEDFISICEENKSLYGMTFDQIKQNIMGVEMRLTWGLNPLANEYVPKPFDRPVGVKMVESNKSKTPLMLGHPVHTTPSTSSSVPISTETAFSRSALAYSNFLNANYNNTAQNAWPSVGPPNLPPNYTQYHPQGQIPVPMIPVPILMNSSPAYNPGPGGPPLPFCAPPFTVQRPSAGYTSMGPRYFGIPPTFQQTRSASAFAQYRPPQQQNRPPPPLPPHLSTGHNGIGYPSFSSGHSHSQLTASAQGNAGFGGPSLLEERSPWGQPLYRTNEFNPVPVNPQMAPPPMDHRQNNFFAHTHSNWPPHQRGLASVNSQVPQFRNHPLQPDQAQPPKPSPWFPKFAGQYSASHHGSSGMSQKFSPEELMYLKRMLEERKSSHLPPDEALEAIQEKLTQAVSGVSETQHPHYNLNTPHSNPDGLTFNNTRSYPPNSLNSGHLSQTNTAGPHYNLASSLHGDGTPRLHYSTHVYNFRNFNAEMNSLHVSTAGNSRSTDHSLLRGVNGNAGHVNGLPASSHTLSTNAQSQSSSSSLGSKNGTLISGLPMGWMGTATGDGGIPTNFSFQSQDSELTSQSSSSTNFGRSYANAVKKPVTHQNSSSPTQEDPTTVDLKEENSKRLSLPKPLMEMDVEFPDFSSLSRGRGNTVPVSRFRADTANSLKKGKKKK